MPILRTAPFLVFPLLEVKREENLLRYSEAHDSARAHETPTGLPSHHY